MVYVVFEGFGDGRALVLSLRRHGQMFIRDRYNNGLTLVEPWFNAAGCTLV